MKAETTSTGRSGMTSLISASWAHCLGYAGRRYITTRFSTSFGTEIGSLHNRSLCRWGRQRYLDKCTHSSVVTALQGHKSMLSVSTTPCDSQLLVLVHNLARVVAGPDRPIPQPKETASTSPGNNQSYTDRASATKDSVTTGASDLYSRLGNAVSERGQMLDGLEDTVNSLRAGSENMVAQVGLDRLPALIVLPSDDEYRRRGLLQNSRPGGGLDFEFIQWSGAYVQYSFGGRSGEWKDLRNGRLVFSCAFSSGRKSRFCIPS